MKEGEEKAAAFVGQITAGVTHEIKNVLAIIKESSGLMQDILSIAGEVPIPHRDKFDHALSTIERQTDRGGDLISQLNKFAHSFDQPVAKIDLYEITKQVVSLSQRFASLKKVRLTICPPEQSLNIETRPVQLQMALFTCIECCLNQMPSGGQIHIHPQEKKERYCAYISCEGDLSGNPDFYNNVSSSAEWAALQEIAACLGGTVTLDDATPGILLSLPGK